MTTMLDQLHFDHDDANPPRSHRRKTRGRSALAMLFVLMLFGVLAVGGWWGYQTFVNRGPAPDFAGTGNGAAVVVEIQSGQIIADIANTLHDAGVVKSAQAFIDVANGDERATGIQPGTYELQQQMSAQSALEVLVDPANRIVDGITIREGLTKWEVYEVLAEGTGIPVEDFEAAGEDPLALEVPEFWFDLSDGTTEPNIEGFLFPSTYEIEPDMSAEDILLIMVNKFLNVADDIGFIEQAEALQISPYEALTVASLAEAEAGVPDDLGKVARVAYNRLYQDFLCNSDVGQNCLEFDTTTNYGLMADGGERKESGSLTHEDLYDEDNVWSTHVHTGLPPTPINSPGQLAMEGAADPPEGDWLFFVAIDEEGNSAFAATTDEHCQNVNEAIANGVNLEPC